MPAGKPGTFTRCTVDDCEGKSVGRGLCRKHYTRWRMHGDASVVIDQSRGVCTVEGCERPHKALGLCPAHYRRLRRHGDTETVLRAHRSGSPEDRFWAQVDQHGPIPSHRPDLGRCWIWTGYINPYGYGEIAIDQRSVHAHSWGHRRFVGPMPEGTEPDHLCRVRHCVRFDHLDPVTHAENCARGARGMRMCCPKGHPFDAENTYYTKLGARVCKTCRREQANLRYQRRQESAGRVVGQRQQTHCRQGHPLEEGNVYHTASGVRICIACNKAKYRRSAERKRMTSATMSLD